MQPIEYDGVAMSMFLALHTSTSVSARAKPPLISSRPAGRMPHGSTLWGWSCSSHGIAGMTIAELLA